MRGTAPEPSSALRRHGRVGPGRARPLAGWARGRLIGDWRRGWRFWSVRLQALAVASGALLVAAPDAIVEAWRALPPDLRAMLPAGAARWLPVLVGALAIVARFIRQERAGHDSSDDR